MATQDGVQPIIIKRVKKGGHGGHHGGAWKVAYADFVTAMMAFFLLLWLLNATTDEQKQGISDYFSPASIAKSHSGSGGVMGGTSLNPDSAMRSDDAQPVGVTIPLAEIGQESDSEGESESEAELESVSDEALRQELQAREAAQFEETERKLQATIQQDPSLQGLSDSIRIDQTPDGLRIQLIDQAGRSNFPRGSHHMLSHTRQLLELVTASIAGLPHEIAIKGHTDATPFVAKNGYTNWELSTDRANATRRALLQAGLSAERIASVTGRADQDLLVPEDPFSPNNRRIAIILLRETPIPLGANSGLKNNTP